MQARETLPSTFGQAQACSHGEAGFGRHATDIRLDGRRDGAVRYLFIVRRLP
jgi:hypothetical protein